MLGKPLLVYTIDAALSSKRLDRTVLSTEDPSIAKIATEHGIKVIDRPKEYATDTAPIDLALRHAVRIVEQQGDKVEIVVVLYGNMPVRKERIIDKVVEKLISSRADSVETYTPYAIPPQRAFRIDDERPIPLKGIHIQSYRRQLLPPAYYPDGAVLALKRDVLMSTEHIPGESDEFFGKDRRAVLQELEDTVDVDEPIDLLWAEFLLNRANNKTGL